MAMNDQDKIDRVNKVCVILSDSHFQIMQNALAAKSRLEKNTGGVLAKHALQRTKEAMYDHSARMRWAAEEIYYLLER
jgi:hypothetical protein